MDYIGEHRFPGDLGHFFIVLSLVASLVATFSYFMAARRTSLADAGQHTYWKKLARIAFITEVISVFSVFVILLLLISNHRFEYRYVWQHSSLSLEFKYLLACIWEGQEGSFLLWSIWHCVIGLVLIKTSKQWEAPVMTIVSFAQFCLATMLLGIYVFSVKIGNNPFLLLRESGLLDNAPNLHENGDITQPLVREYMESINRQGGNDLNPLLQNYWMVIHPPVLFLGFASTIVPFAFAAAGLWTKNFGGWIRHALPWALFSAAVFGVGIMMGAKWAYESLTFGGYWAWDPVENASLVPWLILIAGIHTLLIYKHSGHSLRSTHLFFILSFVFVLYSTFLTRSGILGDTSVHAFTDLGMNAQLYLLLFLFFWVPAILAGNSSKQRLITGITALVLLELTRRTGIPIIAFTALIAGLGFIIYHIQTQVPSVRKEESGSSREFWMFIGALVFFLSSLVIIGQTSLPVFNKIFGTRLATPDDPEFSYNSIQIYVAIILATLTAITQYLRYKDTPRGYFWKKMLVPTAISVVIAGLVLAFGNIDYDTHGPMYKGAIWLATACAIYSIVANAAYIWVGLRGKLNLSGGSISHVGFGMVLLGILLSSSKKEVLSYNTSGIPVYMGKDSKEKTGENLTLVKGIRTDMGRYWVTYLGDSAHPKKQQWYFNIQFDRKDGKERFLLRPNAFINYKGNEGLMANPDSRHYFGHDVFTYITSLPDPERQKKDTANFRTHRLRAGDSLFYSGGYMILEALQTEDNLPENIRRIADSMYLAPLKVYAKTGSIYSVTPKAALARGEYINPPDTILAEDMVLQLQSVNPDRSINLGVKESKNIMQYVTLKAYKFPGVNLLWIGVIITAIGIIISMVRRIQLNRRTAASEA